MQKRISASFSGFVLTFVTTEVWHQCIDRDRGLCTGLIGTLELQLPGLPLHFETKGYFLPGNPMSNELEATLLQNVLRIAEQVTPGKSGQQIVGDIIWQRLKTKLEQLCVGFIPWNGNIFMTA